MKVKQKTPVGNTYFPTHRDPSKEIFATKNIFFLLTFLHLHLIDHIRKQTFEGKKFLQFHSLNFEHIFNF